MIKLASDVDVLLSGGALDDLAYIYRPADGAFQCEGLATAKTVPVLEAAHPGSMIVPGYFGQRISAHNMQPLGAEPARAHL